jgi:putative ABC transport system permease protein
MHDLRLAIRHLVRKPSFSIIAVLTLALGIGANAAVFTVTNAVLLSPLPYRDPGDIVILNERTPQFPSGSVTRYNFDDWRARAKSFTGMGAFHPANMTLTGLPSTPDPERVQVKMITASLLPVLGVSVDSGRGFGEADDRAGAEGVALVSAAFAARRFPDGSATGRVLQLDHQPYTIVGVLPARFELFQPADIYIPFGPWAAALPDDRGWHPGIFPIARLKPGVTIDEARVEMDGIAQQLEAELGELNKNVRVLVRPVQDLMVQNVRPAIRMLTGAVVLVLLIACANAANLLLARAVDRQKEIAVRLALGASRLRIVRQLVVESVVLSSVGGLAGLLLAAWGVSFLTSPPIAGLPRAQNIAIDWRVLLFAIALSVATGIVFGLVPALHATRLKIRESLNEAGRGSAGSSRHTALRAILVVAELGLALVLLVGAGLLLRSFATLTDVSPGFNPDNLIVGNLPLSPRTYADGASRIAVVDRLTARLSALPGVYKAGITTTLPMAGAGPTVHFNRAAYPPKGPDDYVMAGLRAVTPDYLPALGVPLVRGRMLSESDRGSSRPVVVINESMANQFFPDRDPIGEIVQLGTEPSLDFPKMTIVGVVGDTKQAFDAESKAEMFVPYAQPSDEFFAGVYLNIGFLLRTTADADAVAAAARGAVREIDAGQPIVNLRTMRTAMRVTVAQPRFQMVLLTTFASIAVALAAIGVYGVMAYTVSQRTPEIGVRIAMGASPRRVIAMVVWQGARLMLVGTALGLIAAAIAADAVQNLLFEVDRLDPVTFAVAPIVLAIAALLASYIPARRAARISPIAALSR